MLAIVGKSSLTSGYKMSVVKAIDVANWMVARANRERDEEFGEGIGNLKLQKLLYFAQAARLALDNKLLFSDDIYAWDYGPVINSVYHEFKTKIRRPIANPTNDDYKAFDENTNTFLEEVWQAFAKYSAAKLVEMTHAHAPWKTTYDGSRNKIIEVDKIKSYYKDAFTRT